MIASSARDVALDGRVAARGARGGAGGGGGGAGGGGGGGGAPRATRPLGLALGAAGALRACAAVVSADGAARARLRKLRSDCLLNLAACRVRREAGLRAAARHATRALALHRVALALELLDALVALELRGPLERELLQRRRVGAQVRGREAAVVLQRWLRRLLQPSLQSHDDRRDGSFSVDANPLSAPSPCSAAPIFHAPSTHVTSTRK